MKMLFQYPCRARRSWNFWRFTKIYNTCYIVCHDANVKTNKYLPTTIKPNLAEKGQRFVLTSSSGGKIWLKIE